MALDPQAARVLENLEQAGLPLLETLSPDAARQQYEQGSVVAAGTPPPVYSIEEETAQGPLGAIPLRVYRPRDPAGEAMPVLVYLHGGGYVIGSPASHDVVCRSLALAGDCVVVSVDYRMAPEYPFPKPVEDCWAAVNWIHDNIERLGGRADRVAIGGDSAGGNLAAVMCLMARDQGGPSFVHQLLIYPCTDLTRSLPSHKALAEGYRLTGSLMSWFMDHYFSGSNDDRRDPLGSPLFIDNLSQLPPARVVTAGYDPLCDEGTAYHEKLLENGVDSHHRHYPGMIHGFINMTGFLDAARECLDECGAGLKAVFDARARMSDG